MDISNSKVDTKRYDFPKDFIFGAETSSYQVEGTWNEGGKGRSNWVCFTLHKPEKEHFSAIKKADSELELVFDKRDEATADNWVARNPSLIRLSGKHPLNAEPRLSRLMHHGFITPVPLHFVRNHGPVATATWDDWTVEIDGLVDCPMRLTMDQLVNEFPSKEFPATLVCSGNRRKEQNMVKQTMGFNWGAAAISTSVWRGVPLRAILERCRIFSQEKGALNVCFEGAEDLPAGGGLRGYGTSIRKEIAMDPTRDIILAYMQNGERLSPDHGFPVRVIVPGFIGGRMVKWVKRIIVTTQESKNKYHDRDNKLLPSHVDAKLAETEGWWNKSENAINELNINSVITTPCHEEFLSINWSTTERPYTIKGYAYSGGGRKVIRVEASMDGGETWRVAVVDHPEKPNEYGKYWCWCFWSLDVEVFDLLGSKEICVRAWDEAHNTQPEKLIWNLMGMMNNCWFRVKSKVSKSDKGEIGIVFEHPTDQQGIHSGGWMAKERPSNENQTLKKSASSPSMNTEWYSMSEVEKHKSAESRAWIIVHGHVYDCTDFLDSHPGGRDRILAVAGTDCTKEFEDSHSSDEAKKLLEKYRKGELITNSPNNSTQSTPFKEIAPSGNVALVRGEKVQCTLISKTSLTHDVRQFRFALPSDDQVLGLPIGKHIHLCATINDKLCMRSYTPTSVTNEMGHFDLVIKIYFKDPPKFPNGGLMTQHLDSLPLGSRLHIMGPFGDIEYTGKGNFLVQGKQKFAKKLAMIAGGTGITPIYQVMQAILKHPEDETIMYLIYANRTEDDIILRNQIDAWAEEFKDRVKVWYVVSTSVKSFWKYSVGRITEEILREHIPAMSENTLALACGPPANDSICC